jgi:CheY-like chemotaxis protein
MVLGPQEHPLLPPGDYVRIGVTDWGGGIIKELLPKIFDPYFSTKQRGSQKGMGLGLAICHSVVQKHGGAIAVESEPGVGTTFRFLLPASRKLVQREKASTPADRPRRGRILVMDDEEVVRRLVRRLLEQEGHEVEMAGDGQAAIMMYESAQGEGRPFDAVILDLTVRDGVGGKATLRELLTIDPAVKAIIMSGYATDPIVLEPERYGFKGVVAKPFDKLKLLAMLARVLGSVTGDQ